MTIPLLAIAAATVTPPPPPPDDGYADIVVEAIKNPFRLTPTQLREAVEAYTANRATFAPEAPLRFKVFGYRLDPEYAQLRIRLRADDGESIPLNLDAEGRFTLPSLDFAHRRFILQANRKTDAVRIRPYILSPGSTDADLALGDARLQCKVIWAMARPTVSVIARGMIGAAGGLCESAKIGAYFRTEQPIAAAVVKAGAAVKPVQVTRDRMGFRYPGYDKALPNTARLVLTYR